jgi:Flp pilus assembly protein TadG
MNESIRGDAGNAVIETVLVVPIVIVLICFIVFVGRITTADNDITAATKDAARAATLQRDAYAADSAARDTAAASLIRAGIDCAQLNVNVDTSNFAPGGFVRVDIACTVSLAQISQLALPGDKTISAHSIEVIDQWRETP